jgi:hypothetical protein
MDVEIVPKVKLSYFADISIGKIDRPPEVVIFLHICTFGIFQVFSIYRYFCIIRFSGKLAALKLTDLPLFNVFLLTTMQF